jgi:hypothetical protein
MKMPFSDKPFSLKRADQIVSTYFTLLQGKKPLRELLGTGGGRFRIEKRSRSLTLWPNAIMQCQQASYGEALAYMFHLDDTVEYVTGLPEVVRKIISRDLIVMSDGTPFGLHWLLRTVNYVPNPPGQNDSFQSKSGTISLLKLDPADHTLFAEDPDLPCKVWNQIDTWITDSMKAHLKSAASLNQPRRLIRTAANLPQHVSKRQDNHPTGNSLSGA